MNGLPMMSPDLDDCGDALALVEDLDAFLERAYAAHGSFTAALRSLGDSMDWQARAYAADAKPWLSPLELLNGALDGFDPLPVCPDGIPLESVGKGGAA